jgi:ketosteroid isomerase-like protein
MKPFTEAEKEVIKKEVNEQFNQLVSALNQLNAGTWSEFYSKDEFLSSIVSTDYYASRSEWMDLITHYFSTRERQHIEPLEVRVAALTPTLALMTSEEKAEMWSKSGENIKSNHVYTMIWKKEQDGWKVLHSHESWMDEPVN